MARDQHGYDKRAPKSFQYGEPKITRKALAKVGMDDPRAFTLLAPLSSSQFMGRGRDNLTPALMVTLMDMGFTSPGEIETVIQLGLSVEEVGEFQKVGIETAEDLRRAVKAKITVPVAKQFIERGVLDLNSMISMKSGAKVGAGTLTAYQKLEDFTAEDIPRLKKAKASAATVNAAVRVGVKTVEGVLSLIEAKITGDDIRILTLYSMEEALLLAKLGSGPGDAWKLVKEWRSVGVEDAEEMSLMHGALWRNGPKAVKTLMGLLPDSGDEPDWRPYKEAILAFRGSTEIEMLIEAGADTGLIDWFSTHEFEAHQRWGGKQSWQSHTLKVALAAFTPQEIRGLAGENPAANLMELWPSSFPYDHQSGGSLSGIRGTTVDRQMMLDSIEFGISFDTLLDYAAKGFKEPADAAALAAAGWGARQAEIASYGGYSLAEILAHPYNEEAQDDLNLSEIEAESTTTNHAPDPANWDWDEETS